MYNTILAFDPSGSFEEGKGTTGWCIYDTQAKRLVDVGALQAKDYPTVKEYWNAHTKLIEEFRFYYRLAPVIVCEDYFLYQNKAMAQVNSHMETSQLLGILRFHCMNHNVPIEFQSAASVKKRWTDTILLHKNVIAKKNRDYFVEDKRLSLHTRDAIRHAVHYATFKNKI
jgi:Holliday junction resolvasome RuvABC endonuclease subunit